MIYAVIDTNVMVSAMLTHNKQSATFQVMEALFANQIIPLYNEEIIEVSHPYKSQENLYLSRIRELENYYIYEKNC